ncbi:MAG TPA: hypothetical protein VKX24_01310, partial [Acidimicrobiia bacterium]|nr:hypothetical protein [Acidimicrobiia bacterium]
MRRFVRPFLAGAALAAVGAAVVADGVPAGAAPVGAPVRPSVVLLVVPGLTWATAPPSLDPWAKASLAFRTADRHRRVDVYLTIGKGRRTGGISAGAGPLDRNGDAVTLRQWPALVRHDRTLRFGGHLGELGRQLAGHGVAYAVVGEDSGDGTAAALGADRTGRVPRFSAGGAAEA